MMIFDPQKRITPAQALKHPYFDGFQLGKETKSFEPQQEEVGKNYFNPSSEFSNPGSKPRIESRKDVLSRKSNVNKNSFYKNKAVGKLPEYLPNKPTVVGSRGGIPGSGDPDSNFRLPNVGSSSGNQYFKNQFNKPVPSFSKYVPSQGIGSLNGIGSIGSNPYMGMYQPNSQGEQGSIGSSNSKLKLQQDS